MHDYTVIYDGNCRVCAKAVRSLARRDRAGRLEIVPFQDPGVRARFPWIPEKAFQESFQLVHLDGRTWQGAAAIEELLHVLPKGRLLAWLFRIPFVRPIVDFFYRWFARNRSRFGCAIHCR